jgi:TRAP-type C4-dicarboxylate transport system permease small subunit
MSEESTEAARPTDPVGRVLYSISRVLAIIGGLVLCGLAVLTTVSIVGRSGFDAPVKGDFEFVAIGTGVAIFFCLPWCQLMRGNVFVDFFMQNSPLRAKTFCDAIGAILYLLIGSILTWRMVYGGIDMYNYSEMTLTVNFPRWSTFPLSVVLMSFLLVVTLYTVWRSIAETRAGRFFDQEPFIEN